MLLNQEVLKELLVYSPGEGVFRWKAPVARSRSPGDVAGSPNSRGYIRISVLNKSYLAHRLAFLYMTGDWPEGTIDHINGDTSDNRWCNLRQATQQQNLFNRPARTPYGVKNVYWNDGGWDVRFTINKRMETFGRFRTLEEASHRAMEVRRELHGEYANNL